MDYRAAKRLATMRASDVLTELAVTGDSGLRLADQRRVARALTELAGELRRRVTHEPHEMVPVDDPDQVPLFHVDGASLSTCCDNTGFADYVAVPCPNPTCAAVAATTERNGKS